MTRGENFFEKKVLHFPVGKVAHPFQKTLMGMDKDRAKQIKFEGKVKTPFEKGETFF